MQNPFFITTRAAILAPLGLAVFVASASANTTLPPRKPGLWVTTMTMQMSMNGKTTTNAGRPFTSALCSDAATNALEIKRMEGAHGKCSNFDIEGAGNVYTITGTCADPMGGGTMTTRATITIDSDTEIHVVSDTTSPNINGHMAGVSNWLGACPAGVMPGDAGRMVNGQFVKMSNVLNPP